MAPVIEHGIHGRILLVRPECCLLIPAAHPSVPLIRVDWTRDLKGAPRAVFRSQDLVLADPHRLIRIASLETPGKHFDAQEAAPQIRSKLRLTQRPECRV